MAIPFLYQLQRANYTNLSSRDFKVAVIDMDDSGLSANQVSNLIAQDKTMFTYLSIGEAEVYRDYWDGWGRNPPDFLLGENPN